jgi:acyl-CoA dehydrogenase
LPESLSSEHIALATSANSLAQEVMLKDYPTAEEGREAVREASKSAGFFTMTQPAAYGGSEASQLALTVVRETLATHNAPFMEAVFGPSPGVLGGVTNSLRETHLGPLMAGEKRSSFGFTEPDNVERPTSGIIDDGFLTVTGQKSYVTGGAEADFINTLVHIEDRGPSMVVLDTNLDGMVLTQRFSSLDGSHHAAFRFDQVRVSTEAIIGEPGQGLPRAMRQIGDTRMLFAAHACGYMIWVINMLNEHLLQKDKSGTPRGDKDVVRWHYASLRIKAYAARSMLYRTARLADSGENIVNEAMACKAFSTEAIGEIVDTAIQLVGGVALVEGHPLERLYRHVRAWRLAEGASDVLRLNIGRGILELGKGRI